MTHNLVLAPSGHEEWGRYYRECQLLGPLFGLKYEDEPHDWRVFTTYCRSMWSSEMLTVAPEARLMAGQFLGVQNSDCMHPSGTKVTADALKGCDANECLSHID
jgi:hypothetical protein